MIDHRIQSAKTEDLSGIFIFVCPVVRKIYT
jgi:hypothetical protein